MKKNIVLVISAIIFLVLPLNSQAAITFNNGYWSSTFDCPEMTIISTGNNICDGLDVADVYTVEGTYNTQITSSANNPDGGGSRGYRHWLGNSRNVQSSYFRMILPTPQKEVWIRWYQRWQPGFSWRAQIASKNIYMWSNAGQWFYHMTPYTPGTNHDLNTSGWLFNGHSDNYVTLRCNTAGWASTQGGITADGNWDSFEVYMKVNDSHGVADGILRTWINGKLVHETNYDFLGHSSAGDGRIAHIDIGQNQDTANNSGVYYEDFDDIAIAVSGASELQSDGNGNLFIGPISSSPPPSIIRADVDQQNGINSTDAMLTLRKSLNSDMSGTNWQDSPTTGDVNCDGNTSSTDAMLILRYSLGLSMNGTEWCE